MERPEVVVVGSYNQDFVWTTPTLPAPSETRLGVFASGPGGKGFNQAVAAARQGARTLFLGAIGDDAVGAQARATADAFGLAARWERHADSATGTAGILVDATGANLIAVAPGANMRLSTAFVDAERATLERARVLVTQLESNLEAGAAARTAARAARVLTVLNPAPIHADAAPATLREVDVLTPNESEFAHLLGTLGADPATRADAAHAATLADEALHALCRRLDVPVVVLTLGGAGAFVSHADRTRHGDAAVYYRVPAERVRAIDTVGAGDAFTGGLAAALAHAAPGTPLRDAVAHANRVAALACERRGAAAAMPTRDEVLARFGPR